MSKNKLSKKKYYLPDPELDDEVVYFLLYNLKYADRITGKSIMVGWTEDKNLADFYLEFHHCKDIVVKKYEGPYRGIIGTLNDNANEKIEIYWIRTRIGRKVKPVAVPMTTNEQRVLTQSTQTYCQGDLVEYQQIINLLPHLKKKYREAMKFLYFNELARNAIGGETTNFIAFVELDEARLLPKLYPQNFGLEDLS
jgi:hypothetical protein